MFRGKIAPLNPWKSNTLEWTTPLNPGHGNWPGEIPHVHRWPYDYSRPDTEEDFVPQNVPDEVIPVEVGEPRVNPLAPVHPAPVEREAAPTDRVWFFGGLLNFIRLRK